MKFEEFLLEKMWNTAIFSRFSGVDLCILRKVVNKTGNISLQTALRIEAATDGKVKAWDLCISADEIKKEFEYFLEEKDKNKQKKNKKNRTISDEKYSADVDWR